MSTRRSWRWAAVVSAGVCIAACGSSDPPSGAGPGNSSDEPGTQIDLSCDQASFGSAQWTACETRNFAHVSEGPLESVNPMFAVAWQAQGLRNVAQWTARSVSDPSWLSPRSGNTVALPLCTTWALPCLGDPFRYPQSPGPNGEVFYDTEAEVTPVVFYDEGCARISGRIWTPRGDAATFPGIVIENGSVQAPEPLYWWAAQALVRAGYMVMTFDPRGQGRSDQQTPSGELGSNFNQSVFWTGLVNAIDFFRSSSAQPYPHNITCADSYPTVVDAFNPDIARLDADRLGIAGHSLGGIGVSVVQSYGAEGADPWPGLIDADNPVDAVVAWDGIYSTASGMAGNAGGNLLGSAAGSGLPMTVPHKPILGQNGEYGLTPTPFLSDPQSDLLISNFRVWQAAGLPVIEQTIQGSSHYEWSPLPAFPSSSWCPEPATDSCDGGRAQPFAEHYTVAWFDRWLKRPDEPGYATADARLLDDEGAQGRLKYSFRYQSARDFPTRDGERQYCEDIRRGC